MIRTLLSCGTLAVALSCFSGCGGSQEAEFTEVAPQTEEEKQTAQEYEEQMQQQFEEQYNQ